VAGDTLINAIRSQPFQPFVIHMADGRAIPVPHPELIAYKSGSRTAVIVDGDAFESIDLLLATRLRKPNVEEAATSSNDRPESGS